MTRLFSRFGVLFLLASLLVFAPACDEGDPEPDDTTTQNGGSSDDDSAGGSSGSGGDFDLSDVTSFYIADIELTSFDFNESSEENQEFYVEVWGDYTLPSEDFDGSDNNRCIEEEVTVSDLPLGLIDCVSELEFTYSNGIPEDEVIYITLWDEDSNSDDDSFGTISFRPSDFIDKEDGQVVLTLQDNGGSVGYTVKVYVAWD